MRSYNFSVRGRAADDQTWAHSGTLVASPGPFKNLIEEAMRQAYVALSKGEVWVGQTGLECRPPYHITMLLVEEEEDPTTLTL